MRTTPSLALALCLAGCAQPATPRASAAGPVAADERGLSELEVLGKRLFFDASLSEPRGQSCASCHDPARAFAGNGEMAIGVAAGAKSGMLGTRNVPSAMYASFAPAKHVELQDGEPLLIGGLFWDGRADSLEQQATGPFLAANEMGNRSPHDVVDKVQKGDSAGLFRRLFGDPPPDRAFSAVARSIAAYERSEHLQPFASKYDAYLRGQARLNELEAHGLALFKDPEKGNCRACHSMDDGSTKPEDNLFTDFSYDVLGVPRNRAIPENADPNYFDRGVCGTNPEATPPPGAKCGAFRVPTLRNVARKTAFMHNGVFHELRAVVAFYATRDTNPERWYASGEFDDLSARDRENVNRSEVPYDRKRGEAPRLDDDEIDAIVAFLETLSDEP